MPEYILKITRRFTVTDDAEARQVALSILEKAGIKGDFEFNVRKHGDQTGKTIISSKKDAPQ